MTDRVVSFVRALQRVEPDLSVDDATDILWLALQMNKATGGNRAPAQKGSASPAAPLLPADPGNNTHLSDKPAGAVRADDPVPPRPADTALTREFGQAALYQSSRMTKGATELPFRTPAAPALPGKRELLRALRPLVRRGRSAHRQQLHLADTVQRIANEGLWLPCLRPALERWFQVAVLIEHSISMGMWQKLGRELYQMLESAGAFSAVRGYRLVTQEQPTLYPLHARLDAQPRALSPLQLRDPRGRTLVLVITDCVADAWSDGRMARLLAGFANTGPVALLHVFPEYMLERTALAEATPLWLHATLPGAANAELQAAPQDGFVPLPDHAANYLKLPVVTLEPQSLASWARMLTAAAGVWVSGWALAMPSLGRESTIEDQAEPPPSGDAEPELTTLSPAARVSAFRLSASPLARQLARLLTVFRGSGFSLPILRLVRQALLPHARQHHEAEVLLCNLVETLPESAESFRSDPERIRYDFVSGVPELLDTMPSVLQQEPPPNKQTVLESLSRYVEQQLGSTRDFMAVVSALSGLAHGQTEFARLSLELLSRLGARYATLTSAGSASLIEWSAVGHRQRNRVELAAYLGDPVANSLLQRPPPPDQLALAQWLLGLRQWGTLVLADATLAVAEHLAARAVWLGQDVLARMRALLQRARECFAEPSQQEAKSTRTTARDVSTEGLGSSQEMLALQACIDATIAAAVPWAPEQPHGERQQELVLASLANAERVLGDTAHELRAAVTEHLRRQLWKPDSYLPPTWYSNGCQILIAGDLTRSSEPMGDTATALGGLLAAAGYDLLYKGLAGVERIALRAYLAERERSGSPSEHLQLPPLVEGPHYAQDLLVSLQSTSGPRLGQRSPDVPDVTVLLGETDYVAWLIKDRVRMNLPVVPLPWTGSQAQKRFKQLWDLRDRYWAFDGRQLGYIDGWWAPDAAIKAQTERVVQVLDVSLSAPQLSQYRQFALNMFRLLILATSKVESLLDSPRWHSYAASLAGAAYRAELTLQQVAPSEYNRPSQTEARLLREHLPEVVKYTSETPSDQTRKTILDELSTLLPAMREWLAFDFANISEFIHLDATVSSMLVVWLVPLVVEHSWSLARTSLLSAQFRTPSDSRWLATLLAAVRRAHENDDLYQDEIIEIAVTWAQMFLQVLTPEQDNARLSLLRNWLKESSLAADRALIEKLAVDAAPEKRIVSYLLLQDQDLLVPEDLAMKCLRCELEVLELQGEPRPLSILVDYLTGLSLRQPQIYGRFTDEFERFREMLRQHDAKAKEPSAPPATELPPDQPVTQRSSMDKQEKPQEIAASQAASSGLPPYFRASGYDGDAIPEGYFVVCLDGVIERERVFFEVSSFANVLDFFDTLYRWYLSFRYQPYTYGSDWLLVNAETTEILLPWSWLCEPNKRNYELDRSWMSTLLLHEAGLEAGSAWRIMCSDISAYGVAVNETVHHLVAMRDKKQLRTLVAKEILIDSDPASSDVEDYRYTTIFHLTKTSVLGIRDHGAWKQRKKSESGQPTPTSAQSSASMLSVEEKLCRPNLSRAASAT